jgi:putative DNA-invertase from lambdoid prophage Rac
MAQPIRELYRSANGDRWSLVRDGERVQVLHEPNTASGGRPSRLQIQEIEAAGLKVETRRVVSETVSGSSSIEQRPGFLRLLDKMERDDVLIVTKLDRLGRNAIDVGTTVARLAAMGVRVHCLALGGVDLTSPAGKMTMGVINAVAEFERDLLIERTQSGLKRARAEGAVFGRPATLDAKQREAVRSGLAAGASVSALAKQLGTSRQTIMRVRDAAARSPWIRSTCRTARPGGGQHERREPTA